MYRLSVICLIGLASAAMPKPTRSLLSHTAERQLMEANATMVHRQKLQAKAGTGSDFLCPLVPPIGEGDGDEHQEDYFDKLHTVILDGNKVLEGIEDETFKEHYWKEYKEELKCIFASYLVPKQDGGPCGGLKSQFDNRQMQWEKICLHPEKDVVDVYDILTADERTYFYKTKKAMKTTAAYDTYLTLAGEKEVMCMQIKMIDDECAAMKSPRMLPPSQAKKLAPPKEDDDEKKEKK